jgi:hypothetical protein
MGDAVGAWNVGGGCPGWRRRAQHDEGGAVNGRACRLERPGWHHPWRWWQGRLCLHEERNRRGKDFQHYNRDKVDLTRIFGFDGFHDIAHDESKGPISLAVLTLDTITPCAGRRRVHHSAGDDFISDPPHPRSFPIGAVAQERAPARASPIHRACATPRDPRWGWAAWWGDGAASQAQLTGPAHSPYDWPPHRPRCANGETGLASEHEVRGVQNTRPRPSMVKSPSPPSAQSMKHPRR